MIPPCCKLFATPPPFPPTLQLATKEYKKQLFTIILQNNFFRKFQEISTKILMLKFTLKLQKMNLQYFSRHFQKSYIQEGLCRCPWIGFAEMCRKRTYLFKKTIVFRTEVRIDQIGLDFASEMFTQFPDTLKCLKQEV